MNKLIINNEQIKGLVAKICRDIDRSNWRPDYVVGITRGGLIPAVMISHYLNIPCQTLQVSLRDSGLCESNLWMAEDAFGYIQEDQRAENGGWNFLSTKRKNILIVDDINDQGTTINWILNDWQSGCLPNEIEEWNNIWGNTVRFATIVDNLSSQSKIKMSYTGMEVNKAENNVWIDFPWEDWWTK